MAMAMRDSVTVSMSDEMTGMFRCRLSASVRVELRVAREDFRIKRRERDVVEGQAEFVVRRKEFFRRLVERIVGVVGIDALLPCRKMKPDHRPLASKKLFVLVLLLVLVIGKFEGETKDDDDYEPFYQLLPANQIQPMAMAATAQVPINPR